MRSTTNSFASAALFDASWFAVKPFVNHWADFASVSTYGMAEVFLAGINGVQSVMISRLTGQAEVLGRMVYRMGQFAAMVARSEEDQAAYMAAVAMGGALRQLRMYRAAKAVWRAVRGMNQAARKAA